MQGVRRVLSDPRVAAGGIEAAVGKRRKVVAVDDVVRNARVLRHLAEDRLENFSRLLLPRVRLVRRHRERDAVQRECIEDRRLAVFRILRGQRGHRLLKGKKTRDVVDRVLTGIADRVAVRDRGDAGLEVVGRRRLPDLVEAAHRHPPVRHRAGRVRGGQLRERLVGLAVPERVQHREADVEPPLRFGGARDRKVHLPEPGRIAFGVIVAGVGQSKGGCEHQQGGQSPNSHGGTSGASDSTATTRRL